MAAPWAATPRIAAITGIACIGLALAGPGAFADPPRPGGGAAARPRAVVTRPPAHRPAPSADAGAGTGGSAAASGGASGAVSGAPGPAASDAGVVEAKTLDGGTRVFKFSELDIEGRLKSPQLVYFLRRVRAEFGTEDLGHRSFLREMSETRKESSF